MIKEDMLTFPKNLDKPGILRESQPARYTWAGQESNAFADRRRSLHGYAGVSHIRAKIFYPPLSALICVYLR